VSRRPRVIIEGYPHHIVHRGHNRQDIFRSDGDRNIFLNMLSHKLALSECRLMAYCLMQNHVHLMIMPSDRESLIKCMHKLALSYAMYFNATADRRGALWESRYFSSPITDDKYLWRAAKYICLNPVRAGIVGNPCEYKWSSAADLINGIDGPIRIHGWIEEAHRADFRELVLDELEETRINYLLQRGLPYGPPV